jgi:integrase
MSFFRNEKRILELLKDKTPQSRKTVLAAIVVLNGQDHQQDIISKQMKDDVEETKKDINTQTKSKTQSENWESYDAIKGIQQTYETKALDILSAKGKLNETQNELINRFMMLSLSTGVYMPPRRSEMVLIKIKDIDESKDNYIDMAKSEFVYNQYKTVKKYGQQRVGFPPAFKAILKKYLAKVKGQTYLLEHNGQPYLATELTREMHKIFGKKISTSMLRHIYLSDIYKDVPALAEMQERATAMGHSISESLQYVKR